MILGEKSVDDIFGKVKAPPGPSRLYNTDVGTGISNLIVTLLQIMLFTAGILLLIYLLWGGFDWITSEGDSEKLKRARYKIVNAVVGIFIIILALTIFSAITGSVLGIFDISGGGFKFKIPHF